MSKNDYYSDSQLKWAEEKGFKDIELAVTNRNNVIETQLVRSQVARGKPKLDLLKCQDNEALARLDRFNGFHDYDSLDKILLAK